RNQYDAAGRVTSIANAKGATNVANFSYTYDPVGNRVSEAALTGTSSFLYDPVNRLASASYPGGTAVGYTYDATGNRVSIAKTGVATTNYAYDQADRLLTAGPDAYTWDKDGRLSTHFVSGVITDTYTFDPLDRLTKVVK